MKQAKFALTAVAALAVVGGALAFKARQETTNIFVTKAVGTTVYCSAPTTTAGELEGIGAAFTLRAATAPITVAGPCPVLTLHTNL